MQNLVCKLDDVRLEISEGWQILSDHHWIWIAYDSLFKVTAGHIWGSQFERTGRYKNIWS